MLATTTIGGCPARPSPAASNPHFHIRVSASLIRDRKAVYSIKNVLTGEEQILSGENLVAAGYVVNLPPNGSAAFLVTPQNAKL